MAQALSTALQLPETQGCPPPHAAPQAPQFAALLPRSTQNPPQGVSPAAQLALHVPWEQKGASTPHATPQPPQFAGSTLVSTQAAPHTVELPGQMSAHCPAAQVSPAAQAFAQAPQLATSCPRSTQMPPQAVAGERQGLPCGPGVSRRERAPQPTPSGAARTAKSR
jgi:hypothetical protein